MLETSPGSTDMESPSLVLSYTSLIALLARAYRRGYLDREDIVPDIVDEEEVVARLLAIARARALQELEQELQ